MPSCFSSTYLKSQNKTPKKLLESQYFEHYFSQQCRPFLQKNESCRTLPTFLISFPSFHPLVRFLHANYDMERTAKQSLTHKTWHLPLSLSRSKQMTRLIHVKNARERGRRKETKRRQFTVTETGTREKSLANLLPSRMRTKNGELAFNAEPSLKGTLRKGRKAIISFGKWEEKEYRSVSSKQAFTSR